MMAKRYRAQDIGSLTERPIFFDANVILYVFFPTGSPSWSRDYSKIFKALLNQKNRIAIDVNVVSEVINRAIRIEYEKHLRQNGIGRDVLLYKKYRDSADGQSALSDIHGIFKKTILARFALLGKAFRREEIEAFLNTVPLDFSDHLILATCKENSCILLTNDKDFADSEIDILTCNPALLG